MAEKRKKGVKKGVEKRGLKKRAKKSSYANLGGATMAKAGTGGGALDAVKTAF